MQKSFLSLVLIASVILVSCKKENVFAELKRETEEKIMGKWTVEKRVHQEYDPIPTLKSTEAYTGTVKDYYIFQPNKVEIADATKATEELFFEVINPSQVWIGDRVWWIGELTSTTLILYIDRNDVENNKRYVTNFFLTKK